jgi:hypothetical protein
MKNQVLGVVDDNFSESERRIIGGNDGSQGDEIGPAVAVSIVTDVEESVGRDVPI